jgi:hypothetical protein
VVPLHGLFFYEKVGSVKMCKNYNQHICRNVMLSILILLIGTGAVFSEEKKCIVIDSLCGLAEVQRAGQNDWTFCKVNQKLFNNDAFRVLDKGLARLRWPDGSVAYVHKNTQIVVNLLARKDGSSLSHTTILLGAIFFVVKKMVPSELVNDTKVYTPTAVIAIRGTSFLVDVKNNLTCVKMVCGTVLAGNIKKNVSMYLGAAFKTVITPDTDPIIPTAVLNEDLDSIKMWVPSQIINLEMEKQQVEAKRNFTILSGKLDEKCVVVSFTDNSGYQGHWNIRQQVPQAFVRVIKEHHPQMNISYTDTAGPDLLADAYKHNTRYIVSGTIETFSLTPRAAISVRADQYSETLTANVKIRLEVVDAAEKKVISEENLVGEITRKRKDGDGWDQLKNIPFNYDDEKFRSSLIGVALKQALEQSIERCDAILGL